MIHAALDLATILFDVISSWLKHDLGPADYRIVRLVFFSAIAAWAAFALVRSAVSLTHGIMRLVLFRIPQGAFQLICHAAKNLAVAIASIRAAMRGVAGGKKKNGSKLVRGERYA